MFPEKNTAYLNTFNVLRFKLFLSLKTYIIFNIKLKIINPYNILSITFYCINIYELQEKY